VFISKVLKTKSENRLVALYAGFDTREQAQRFAAWCQVNWSKTSFDVAVRPGQRTQSLWEVKVRRPNQGQLAALVKKVDQPPTATQVMASLDVLPTCTDRKRAITRRGVSIT
jgi:hypothetical protein